MNETIMKVKDILDRQKAIEQLIEDLEFEQTVLKESLDLFRVRNKLYCPLEDLSKYKGEEVASITLIDSIGKEFTFDEGDLIEITDKGYFYFSDYNNGIIEYDEEEKCYMRHIHFSTSKLELIGFRNLILGSQWDEEAQKRIEESFDSSLFKEHLNNDVKVGSIRKKDVKLENIYN